MAVSELRPLVSERDGEAAPSVPRNAKRPSGGSERAYFQRNISPFG
jgi:hypothetical protein